MPAPEVLGPVAGRYGIQVVGPPFAPLTRRVAGAYEPGGAADLLLS